MNEFSRNWERIPYGGSGHQYEHFVNKFLKDSKILATKTTERGEWQFNFMQDTKHFYNK